MWRFAPDEFAKVYLDDAGWHVEVCSGRRRKGVILTMRGGMWTFAADDVVKVSS